MSPRSDSCYSMILICISESYLAASLDFRSLSNDSRSKVSYLGYWDPPRKISMFIVLTGASFKFRDTLIGASAGASV